MPACAIALLSSCLTPSSSSAAHCLLSSSPALKLSTSSLKESASFRASSSDPSSLLRSSSFAVISPRSRSFSSASPAACLLASSTCDSNVPLSSSSQVTFSSINDAFVNSLHASNSSLNFVRRNRTASFATIRPRCSCSFTSFSSSTFCVSAHDRCARTASTFTTSTASLPSSTASLNDIISDSSSPFALAHSPRSSSSVLNASIRAVSAFSSSSRSHSNSPLCLDKSSAPSASRPRAASCTPVIRACARAHADALKAPTSPSSLFISSSNAFSASSASTTLARCTSSSRPRSLSSRACSPRSPPTFCSTSCDDS